MTTERFVPERCKAITYSRRGDPKDVLQYEDDYLVQRSISKDSVLVKIEAAGINPVDWKTMKFLPSLWGKKVAGKDYSGTIVEVREGSIDKRFKIGDKVYGQIEFTEKMKNGSGTLVQYAICPIETIAIRPNRLSAIDLGGITTVAQTALVVVEYSNTLFQSGKKKPRILVCGGSSAVGLMAIPILKHKGAFVASTCSKAKFEVVSKRGADETFDCE
jgi:NADPH:quinone reductase-like Zn-dependent oxidoreductase